MRYYDCQQHEILPQCRDGEIMLRDADQTPKCVFIGPTPCPSAPMLTVFLLAALILGAVAAKVWNRHG